MAEPEQDHYEQRNAQECFHRAIQEGRLSKDPSADNFAGRYMYMGTWNGQDSFKNTMTREYLW